MPRVRRALPRSAWGGRAGCDLHRYTRQETDDPTARLDERSAHGDVPRGACRRRLARDQRRARDLRERVRQIERGDALAKLAEVMKARGVTAEDVRDMALPFSRAEHMAKAPRRSLLREHHNQRIPRAARSQAALDEPGELSSGSPRRSTSASPWASSSRSPLRIRRARERVPDPSCSCAACIAARARPTSPRAGRSAPMPRCLREDRREHARSRARSLPPLERYLIDADLARRRASPPVVTWVRSGVAPVGAALSLEDATLPARRCVLRQARSTRSLRRRSRRRARAAQRSEVERIHRRRQMGRLGMSTTTKAANRQGRRKAARGRHCGQGRLAVVDAGRLRAGLRAGSASGPGSACSTSARAPVALARRDRRQRDRHRRRGRSFHERKLCWNVGARTRDHRRRVRFASPRSRATTHRRERAPVRRRDPESTVGSRIRRFASRFRPSSSRRGRARSSRSGRPRGGSGRDDGLEAHARRARDARRAASRSLARRRRRSGVARRRRGDDFRLAPRRLGAEETCSAVGTKTAGEGWAMSGPSSRALRLHAARRHASTAAVMHAACGTSKRRSRPRAVRWSCATTRCHTCAVGDKHAKRSRAGKGWPDGSPIATTTPSVHSRPARPP